MREQVVAVLAELGGREEPAGPGDPDPAAVLFGTQSGQRDRRSQR